MTPAALLYNVTGGMAEWTNAAVLKTVEGSNVFRGFESHSLRHSQVA